MNVVKLTGTAWLVHDGKRGIIVDAARRGRADVIKRKIEPLGISIPLLFLTHTHYDHTGCAGALYRFTGGHVIVGAAEADCLRKGYTPVPKGTNILGRFMSRAGHTLVSKQAEHYEPITKDIIPVDAERDLGEYGFDARVLPLGAHTFGSIGLLIGDYFFAGDTVFGIGGMIYPPFADCPDEIRYAWEKILATKAKYICPGHGGMVSRKQLEKGLASRYARQGS